MDSMDSQTRPEPNRPPQGYEPPRVEHVLGAQDLEREVLYAGTVSPPTTTL